MAAMSHEPSDMTGIGCLTPRPAQCYIHAPMQKILIAIELACLFAVSLTAQAPQGRGNADSGVARLRAFDPAAVERGKTLFGEKCASCHRANARGGQGFSGPDLLRSVLVLQ